MAEDKPDKITTFNHAFDVAFSVSNSEYEDWENCLLYEKEKVFAALFERIVELFGKEEYLEAISGFDTYEELESEKEDE